MGCDDFSRALLRGRSVIAAARMEDRAIPMDVEALTVLRQYWTAIQSRLVERIDQVLTNDRGRARKKRSLAEEPSV